jgi:hypothetical protein
MLTRIWMSPASLFETMTVEMSGAAGFSPVESVYVVLLAAIRVGAAFPEGNAPVAPAGTATTATARARTSQGDFRRRTRLE